MKTNLRQFINEYKPSILEDNSGLFVMSNLDYWFTLIYTKSNNNYSTGPCKNGFIGWLRKLVLTF